MANDVRGEGPFSSADSLPVGLKKLQNVQVTQVVMWRIGLFLLATCLKGLHLVVDEVARGNLPPAGYELKDGMEGNTSKGGDDNGANNGGAM